MPYLTCQGAISSFNLMTGSELLGLKQELAKLSESERREIIAFLIRLGQEGPEWKKETARRLNAMAEGRKTSVEDLRQRLTHGE